MFNQEGGEVFCREDEPLPCLRAKGEDVVFAKGAPKHGGKRDEKV